MVTVFAKQDGNPRLFALGTAERGTEARQLCQTYRQCAPTGWRVGIQNPGIERFQSAPCPDVAVVLIKWHADAEAGVDKYAGIRQEEIARHERRKALVESGKYTWADFDDDTSSDEEEEEA